MQKPKKGRPFNIRNFPEDLYWSCKIRAAEKHMTLLQFVVTVLRKAVEDPRI